MLTQTVPDYFDTLVINFKVKSILSLVPVAQGLFVIRGQLSSRYDCPYQPVYILMCSPKLNFCAVLMLSLRFFALLV